MKNVSPQHGRVPYQPIANGALAGCTRSELAVYLALAAHADSRFSAAPSVDRLGRLGGMSERTIQRAIHSLGKRGLIRVKTGGGRYHSSTYWLVDAPWPSNQTSTDEPRKGDTHDDTVSGQSEPDKPRHPAPERVTFQDRKGDKNDPKPRHLDDTPTYEHINNIHPTGEPEDGRTLALLTEKGIAKARPLTELAQRGAVPYAEVKERVQTIADRGGGPGAIASDLQNWLSDKADEQTKHLEREQAQRDIQTMPPPQQQELRQRFLTRYPNMAGQTENVLSLAIVNHYLKEKQGET